MVSYSTKRREKKVKRDKIKQAWRFSSITSLSQVFSIIKDEKEKDKVGVGDKPPPPSFNILIKFDPI